MTMAVGPIDDPTPDNEVMKVPDEQDEAEALDEDEIDGLDIPPDRPLGVADALARDITVPGEEAQDSLAERISREEPDLAPVGDSDLDVRDGLIADDTDLEGELGERDGGDIALSDSVLTERDDRSAEEQALHIERDGDDESLTDILSENEARRP
jgi:hypothetical protein